MGAKIQGILLLIGGAEDKKGKCVILRKFLSLSGEKHSCIVVLTTATEKPEEVGVQYKNVFTKLGAGRVDVLDIDSRTKANDKDAMELIRSATGIFFTGGDQLRITSVLGGTLADEGLHEAYRRGVVVAGTSAGASVVSSTMIVAGPGDDTPKKNTVNMAPGMGLLQEVVVDQHFAQRGRLGRLLTAVAQNPYILGVGLDEDTAILISPDAIFTVIGTQTVTIVDGRTINHANVTEMAPDQPLALTEVKLHVLPPGYSYDMGQRVPILPSPRRK